MATKLSKIISQFYEDPENERRYQEWLASKKKRGPATNDSRAQSITGQTPAYHIATTTC